MTQKSLSLNHYAHRRSGFTFIEILIAMFVFGIGSVSIASLLYVATTLQKNTLDVVQTHQASNAIAAMTGTWSPTYSSKPESFEDANGNGRWDEGESFTDANGNQRWDRTTGDLGFYYADWDYDGDVDALPDDPDDPRIRRVRPVPGFSRGENDSVLVGDRWVLADRGYPASALQVVKPTELDYYWIPMIVDRGSDHTKPDWKLYICVMKNDVDQGYERPADAANDYDPKSLPGLFSISDVEVDWSGVARNRIRFDNDSNDDKEPDLVIPGDSILDNNGVTYQVIEATDEYIVVSGDVRDTPNPVDEFWYGRPASPGEPSPLKQIIRLD